MRTGSPEPAPAARRSGRRAVPTALAPLPGPTSLRAAGTGIPPTGTATAGAEHIGTLDEENWLEEAAAFGPGPDSRSPLAGGRYGRR